MTVRQLLRLLEQVPPVDRDKPVALIPFPDPLNDDTIHRGRTFQPIGEAKLGRAYVGDDGQPYHFPASSTDAVAIAIEPWKST